MKGRHISYSQAERDWIRANAALPRRELHIQFVARFARPDVSQANITGLCKREGWLTGRTGRFEPGQDSWNKGRKGHCPPGCEKGWFKKGQRTGKAAQNYKPIGTERMTKDGYLERKIHNGRPFRSRWRAVHLIRWEERNGPAPDGCALKCLDGDRANTDPDNWVAVPRALLARLAGKSGRDYDNAPPELKPLILTTAQLEQAAQDARKDKL